MLERGGNDVAREIWMGRWKGKLLPTIKDSDGDRLEKIRSHITRKYIDKKWVPDPTTAKRHAFARGGRHRIQLQPSGENPSAAKPFLGKTWTNNFFKKQ